MESLLNISQKDYFDLIERCKRVDPVNYLDIAHDHILTGKKVTSLKWEYIQPFSYDLYRYETTCKPCNKCNEIKPIGMFRIISKHGNIYTLNKCIQCENNEVKKYYQKNREKILKNKKKYRFENSEKIKEYQKNHRLENREKVLGCQKKHYQKNREKILEYKKKYRLENKEKEKERNKKYREKNREKIRDYQRKYRLKKKNNYIKKVNKRDKTRFWW